MAELTGGRVNYYLVKVDHPQREDQEPYRAECEDIIEALELNPDEANIFKEIWRSANARLHNGKPGHKALYGAEKIVHYAGRILRRVRRQQDAQDKPAERNFKGWLHEQGGAAAAAPSGERGAVPAPHEFPELQDAGVS